MSEDKDVGRPYDSRRYMMSNEEFVLRWTSDACLVLGIIFMALAAVNMGGIPDMATLGLAMAGVVFLVKGNILADKAYLLATESLTHEED